MKEEDDKKPKKEVKLLRLSKKRSDRVEIMRIPKKIVYGPRKKPGLS